MKIAIIITIAVSICIFLIPVYVIWEIQKGSSND